MRQCLPNGENILPNVTEFRYPAIHDSEKGNKS